MKKTPIKLAWNPYAQSRQKLLIMTCWQHICLCQIPNKGQQNAFEAKNPEPLWLRITEK
jgi:hypothetical protein